jgi:hypothetical protein
MALWNINCMEDRFPGMWQRWSKSCVTVGWRAALGFLLSGIIAKEHGPAWSCAHASFETIETGDHIIVSLRIAKVALQT